MTPEGTVGRHCRIEIPGQIVAVLGDAQQPDLVHLITGVRVFGLLGNG